MEKAFNSSLQKREKRRLSRGGYFTYVWMGSKGSIRIRSTPTPYRVHAYILSGEGEWGDTRTRKVCPQTLRAPTCIKMSLRQKKIGGCRRMDLQKMCRLSGLVSLDKHHVGCFVSETCRRSGGPSPTTAMINPRRLVSFRR